MQPIATTVAMNSSRSGSAVREASAEQTNEAPKQAFVMICSATKPIGAPTCCMVHAVCSAAKRPEPIAGRPKRSRVRVKIGKLAGRSASTMHAHRCGRVRVMSTAKYVSTAKYGGARTHIVDELLASVDATALRDAKRLHQGVSTDGRKARLISLQHS